MGLCVDKNLSQMINIAPFSSFDFSEVQKVFEKERASFNSINAMIKADYHDPNFFENCK